MRSAPTTAPELDSPLKRLRLRGLLDRSNCNLPQYAKGFAEGSTPRRVESFSDAALALVFLFGLLLIPFESALPEPRSYASSASHSVRDSDRNEDRDNDKDKDWKNDHKRNKGKHKFIYCLTTRGRIVARNKSCKYHKGETPVSLVNDSRDDKCEDSHSPCSTASGKGVLAFEFASTGPAQVWTASAGLPQPALSGLNGEDVVIAASSGLVSACGTAEACLSAEENAESATCTGSAASPTAPPGKVCIYPLGVANTSGLFAEAVPNNGPAFGFTVSWQTVQAGQTSFYGVWAYTPAG